MSALDTSLRAWLNLILAEGFRLDDEPTANGEVHLKAFISAWGHTQGLGEKQSARLFENLSAFAQLRRLYLKGHGHRLYGDETFDRLTLAIFGNTVLSFLDFRKHVRRIILECSDVVHARCLGELIGNWAQSQGYVFVKDLLADGVDTGVNSLSDRLKQRQDDEYTASSDPLFLTVRVDRLKAASDLTLLKSFPSHQAQLQPGIWLTLLTQEEYFDLNFNLRIFLGAHGHLELPSLNDVHNQGLGYRCALETDFEAVLGKRPTKTLLDRLEVRLEGRRLPFGRQTILNLIYLLDTRSVVSHFEPTLCDDIFDKVFASTQKDSSGQSHEHLRDFLARRFSQNEPLPKVMNDIERDAYLHAARIAQIGRENVSVRIQDIADVLGVPRQTASRKWHQFGLKKFGVFESD